MSLKSAQKTDTNLYTLELTCDKERFGAALQKAYEEQKGNITVPGFRKGKAPRAFIEKYYGESVFYDSAIDAVFPELYREAIEESKLETVG
ncbi:MAG TPA: trigger factor family protein, partial [Clostridiales bacterium]|nr:trigger factor family protein [Clostridiales bacterium]